MSRLVGLAVLAASVAAAVTGCTIEDCDPSWECHDSPRPPQYQYSGYTGGSSTSGPTTSYGDANQQCLNYCNRLSVCGAPQAQDFNACVSACKVRFQELPQQTAELCACMPQARCEDAIQGRCSPGTSGGGGTGNGSSTGGSTGQQSNGNAPGAGDTSGNGGPFSTGGGTASGSGGASPAPGSHGYGGSSTAGSSNGSGGSTHGGRGGAASGSGGAGASAGTAAAGTSCGAASGAAGEAPAGDAGAAGAPEPEHGAACTCDCQCPAPEKCVNGYCGG